MRSAYHTCGFLGSFLLNPPPKHLQEEGVSKYTLSCWLSTEPFKPTNPMIFHFLGLYPAANLNSKFNLFAPSVKSTYVGFSEANFEMPKAFNDTIKTSPIGAPAQVRWNLRERKCLFTQDAMPKRSFCKRGSSLRQAQSVQPSADRIFRRSIRVVVDHRK